MDKKSYPRPETAIPIHRMETPLIGSMRHFWVAAPGDPWVDITPSLLSVRFDGVGWWTPFLPNMPNKRGLGMNLNQIRHAIDSRYDDEWKALTDMHHKYDWPENLTAAIGFAFCSQVAVELMMFRRSFGIQNKPGILKWLRRELRRLPGRFDLNVADDYLDNAEQHVQTRREPLYRRDGETITFVVRAEFAQESRLWEG